MDKRANGRIIVDKQVAYLVAGERDYVFLYDLSNNGCMIELANLVLKEGDKIQLELSDFVTVTGQVVWRAARNAGIAFEAHLHESFVTSLGFYPTSLPFDRALARDRFGQAL